MSALFISVPKDALGPLLVSDGAAVPVVYSSGLPFENEELAIDTNGAIAYFHMGLPFTQEGRVVAVDAVPAFFGGGATPFDPAERVCFLDELPAMWSSGVPYTVQYALSALGIDPDGVRITDQPDDWTGEVGETAVFTVTATSGDASPITYQWQEFDGSTWNDVANGARPSGSIAAGATTDTLTITNAQIADSGSQFRVVVTNSANSRTSLAVSMTVLTTVFFLIAEDDEFLLAENDDSLIPESS